MKGSDLSALNTAVDVIRNRVDGLGIAELTCFLGDDVPNLVRVWPHLAPVRRPCWLIVHQDMRRAARIKAVSAAIESSFRRQRRKLEDGGRPDARPAG